MIRLALLQPTNRSVQVTHSKSLRDPTQIVAFNQRPFVTAAFGRRRELYKLIGGRMPRR